MATVVHETSAAVLPPAARIYSYIDLASGAALMLILVLSPWLFGTTEPWSISFLNGAAISAGFMLVLKWLLRWHTGALTVDRISFPHDYTLRTGIWLIRGLAVCTALTLVFILLSAVNARASFDIRTGSVEYYQRFIRWLPYSYDRQLTWNTFWVFLSMACYFWALRDWIMHPPPDKAAREDLLLGLPPRFRAVLWCVCVNGAALALAGTFQRLSGTDKLLWTRPSYDGDPLLMFGPFAFRGNASAYFNLCWPLALGFWWTQRQKAGRMVWDGRKAGGAPHILLLLCASLTGAAPLIATSRGGTIVALFCLALVLFVFLVNRKANWQARCAILLVGISVIGLGGALGWDQLGPRLRELFRTPYANPNEIHATTQQMMQEAPFFGFGPGAFRAVYPLYRDDPRRPSHAFLHDDWMETRLTFGWAGSMLLLIMLGLALTRWFVPGGINGPWELVAMLWISLGGCLAYAKFSFPLQVYSILVLVLTVLCILSCLSSPENSWQE